MKKKYSTPIENKKELNFLKTSLFVISKTGLEVVIFGL